VYCEVYPSDGDLAAASPGRSPDITILNGIQSIAITPAQPRTGDWLGYALNWVAPDAGEVAYEIAWTLGVAPAGATPTISPDRTARGQQWTVAATAYLDLPAGGRHEAPARSATLSIGDTPPPAPVAAGYSVALPQAGQDVAVQVTQQPPDADGDVITWEVEWSEAADFAGPVTGTALGQNVTAMGDVWYSRVRAVTDDRQRETAYSDWHVLDPLRVGLGRHTAAMYCGWNLFAFPVEPVDDYDTDGVDETTIQGLFGNHIRGWPWAWDPEADGYVLLGGGVRSISPVVPMHGFWVFHKPAAGREAGTPTDISVLGWLPGREDGDDTVRLLPGWNLIGVAADFAAPPAWAEDPAIAWPPWAWENNGSGGIYRPLRYLKGDRDDRLKAGQGYWIYLHGDTPLAIDVTPQ